MRTEEITTRVLYRDALMLVIDKPAGLPVHPGPKGGETLLDHLDALRFGLPRRPEVAHRLDKDTSGCLVLGRHAQALARLGELFKSNRVDKIYWAVVAGGPTEDEGEIDRPLARRSAERGWWMKVDARGQPALTRWRVLGQSGAHPTPRSRDEAAPLTLLELRPITGRTHQLRVHCAAMGWAIVGDAIYGNAPRVGGPGLQLHARAVAVPLYPNRPAITVDAPTPPHMRQLTAWRSLSARLDGAMQRI